jgi:hypothetical protein
MQTAPGIDVQPLAASICAYPIFALRTLGRTTIKTIDDALRAAAAAASLNALQARGIFSKWAHSPRIGEDAGEQVWILQQRSIGRNAVANQKHAFPIPSWNT